MKRQHIIYFFISVMVIAGFGGCEGYLDVQPTERLTMDQVFSQREETEEYLWRIYGFIPDEANWWSGQGPWVGSADEGDMTWERAGSGYITYLINEGNYGPTTGKHQYWHRYYEAIRSASVFITRIDENQELSPDQITLYKAEARFLRAYYYFMLLRQYGPVIIMPDEPLPVDAPIEALKIPRSTYDECVNYIVEEIDRSVENLPLTIDDTQWFGRITKGAALALKSRLLLYAASPLYNGNQDYASFTNPDGTQLINQTYDQNKWKRAADAAKAVIDLGVYDLYTYQNSNQPELNGDPYLSYKHLFLDKWNEEIIFARSGNSGGGNEVHCAPRSVNGWSGAAATQKQVDAYFMANGKAIDEAGSGYVEEGFSTQGTEYTEAGTWNMYVNREPRFYASIMYNGRRWPFTGKKVELFAFGDSGKKGSHDHSKTGYLIYKFVNPNSDIQRRRMPQKVWIYFRLGEIYLNYAEALNEYDPGNTDIARYVNLIRNRAGLPDLPLDLSQEEMRKHIRQERRVELAFESHRFFDTRRWKIAEQTDGGPFEGMNVDAGDSFDDEEFYQRTVFERRVFQKKQYLWPMPQSEIDRNDQLLQNPGW